MSERLHAATASGASRYNSLVVYPTGAALVLVGMILIGISARDSAALLVAAAAVAFVAATAIVRHLWQNRH